MRRRGAAREWVQASLHVNRTRMTETRANEPGAAPSAASVSDRELALVRAGYEIWNAGDIAGLAERFFHKDIEYHNSPEWPGQPVYRGSDAVARFLKEEVADVIGLEVEIQRIEVIGEEIVIALQASTRVAQSGLDFGSGALFHVARLRDDRVIRVRVYLEERQALEAAKQPVSSPPAS